MSDLLLQQLRAANPVRADAVALLQARVRDQALVLPPTAPKRNRRWPRRRLIVAVCVIAALLGGPALAYRLGVIDFSSAPAASAPVVEEFASLAVGAPPGMDPHVIAGQTRLVGTIGGRQLWVAPTAQGGLCDLWSNAGGGCDAVGGWPLSVTWSDPASPFTPGQSPRLFAAVAGFAHSRWADDVEITLSNGTTVHPEILWVSAPISAGFFSYDAPAGQTISTVSALHEGTVVAADSHGNDATPGPHPFADLSKEIDVASVTTDAGPVTLWTAPTRTDERCVWLQFQQQEIGVVPCLPEGYVHQAAFAFAVHNLGGHEILAGECGYSAIQFIHPNGTTRTVPCSDGLVFADLEPADSAGTLRALDANGRPLPGSTTSLAGTNTQQP